MGGVLRSHCQVWGSSSHRDYPKKKGKPKKKEEKKKNVICRCTLQGTLDKSLSLSRDHILIDVMLKTFILYCYNLRMFSLNNGPIWHFLDSFVYMIVPHVRLSVIGKFSVYCQSCETDSKALCLSNTSVLKSFLFPTPSPCFRSFCLCS